MPSKPLNLTRMSKKKLQALYDQSTRNYSAEQRQQLERDPMPNPADPPHLAHAKSIYRALTPHLAGNGHWDAGGFQLHA